MVLLILQSGTKVDTTDIVILSLGLPVTVICFALGYFSVGRTLQFNKMNSLNVNAFIWLFYRSCYFLYLSQVRWENKKLGIAYAISLLLAPAYIIFKIYEVLIINTFNIPKMVNILLIPKILMNYRLYICKILI